MAALVLATSTHGATGGLAARLMMTPAAINKRIDVNNSLSTVNHQRASAPLSLLLISMTGCPFAAFRPPAVAPRTS